MKKIQIKPDANLQMPFSPHNAMKFLQIKYPEWYGSIIEESPNSNLHAIVNQNRARVRGRLKRV